MASININRPVCASTAACVHSIHTLESPIQPGTSLNGTLCPDGTFRTMRMLVTTHDNAKSTQTAHPNMCIYSHTTLTRSQFRSAYAVDCTFRIMRMLVTTHDNAKSTQYHPYIYAIQPIPNYMCACTLTTTLTILSQVPDVCRHRMPGLPLCMTAAREPAVLLARKYDRHSRALPSRRRSLLRHSIARLRPAILMRCQPSLRAGTSRLFPDEVLMFEAFTAPVEQPGRRYGTPRSARRPSQVPRPASLRGPGLTFSSLTASGPTSSGTENPDPGPGPSLASARVAVGRHPAGSVGLSTTSRRS